MSVANRLDLRTRLLEEGRQRLERFGELRVEGGLPISFAISGMERTRRSPSSMPFLSTMVICAMSFLLS